MPTPPPRLVTLVLVDARGALLGALLPFQAATTRWLDIEPVVRAVREQHALRVTVLRLLEAERSNPNGGAVTYLAEVDADSAQVQLLPWSGRVTSHALRRSYACVGGPAADLTWARSALATLGATLTGEPVQMRTSCLSSVWRLPTMLGSLWLKVVPPFFAHEGSMLAALRDAPVPRLLARAGARLLLAHLDGADCDAATLPERLRMIDLLVGLQSSWLGREDTLFALGLPDCRAPALTAAITAFVERCRAGLAPEACTTLDDFVARLHERFDAVAACGFPNTLVHGDFHAGNVRRHGAQLTLLDWGDCVVGHPLLDLPAFLRIAPVDAQAAQTHWMQAWRRVLPQSNPERAALLLAPVAALRLAMLSQAFIDASEESEHAYHRRGVPAWLQHTVDLLRVEQAG